MPKKYNLTPDQADKVLDRWKSVKEGKVCKQHICPETLTQRRPTNRSCKICFKLFSDVMTFEITWLTRKKRPKINCPCFVVADEKIIHHVRAALEEFYGEPL